MNLKNLNHKFIRSFGRRKTSAIKQTHQSLIDKYYSSRFFNPENISILVDNLLSLNQNIILEIGFGSGEHIFQQAKNNPNTIFLGADVWINGCSTLLSKCVGEDVSNVIILNDDVRHLLDLINQPIFSKIYVLFADPWHKARHFKRRIIGPNNLDLIASSLLQNSEIIFATDIQSYYDYALEALLENSYFDVDDEYIKNPFLMPKDHVKTKYQMKALSKGVDSKFIRAFKV